jgi:hypothetical protein
MVRTSATRPIVVVPPTQPGIEAVVATGNWGVQTAWQHFAAFIHSTQTPKPLLLATSDGACSIRPQQTGEDYDQFDVHISEPVDEDWPR